MSPLPPVYKGHGQAYKADTCRPVAQAAEEGLIEYNAIVRGHYPGDRIPKGVLPGVRNLGWWNVHSEQTWGLEWHRNEGIELTFLENGRLEFGTEGREYQLKAGDLTLSRPWQRHRLGAPNVTPSLLHWLILDVGVRRPHQDWHWPSWLVLTPQDRDELTLMLRQAVEPVWHVKDDLLQCFQKIGAAVAEDNEGSNASRLAVYLNELFILLLDTLRQGRVTFDHSLTTSYQTVGLFWDDMIRNARFLAEEWTVGEMADQCGMGITQFTQHCKKLTNMTPMEYLAKCRIEASAKALVAEPDRSITDIGFSLGFSSSQYFAKVFRKFIGCSPTEYRRQGE